MRGAHRLPVEDEIADSRYTPGVAYAPDRTTPVTAVPSYGRYSRPVQRNPVTAVPATAVPDPGVEWRGPKQWDGWGDGPVPYPRPPEWRGPPPRRGAQLVRRVALGIAAVGLAALLGAAGLFVGLKVGSPSAEPGATTGAAPNELVPGLVNADPIETPGEPSAEEPAPPKALDTGAIVSSVNKSVVNINSTLGLRNERAAGTGIILTSTGLVLTNNHVIAGATAISGVTVANGKTFKATVVGYDRSHDIAVIQLTNATGLPRIGVADSSSVKVGDPIVAIGNAGGAGGTPTAVTGSVTALNQTITAQDPEGTSSQRLSGLIQVAADIRSGDSGGPLVDRTGRLIGVNSAASFDPQDQAAGGKGFAIPSNAALGIAQQIQAGKASSSIHIGATALLGVSAVDGDGPGAAVTGLLADGPAQDAGLVAGDVIRSLDGQDVDGAKSLTAALDRLHPDDKVEIVWVDRQGRQRTATVELAAGPAG